MPGARLVLLRHGESTWNAEGRWQGWGDPPLSARGREQAREVAERLAGAGVTAVVSSDLRRASETAALVAEAVGLAPLLDARLRERDLGRWSGLREEEIRSGFADELERFRARDPEVRPGGGESRIAFAGRVQPVLQELAASEEGLVVVVTHLGVIRLVAPELRPTNAEWVVVPAALLRPVAPDA